MNKQNWCLENSITCSSIFKATTLPNPPPPNMFHKSDFSKGVNLRERKHLYFEELQSFKYKIVNKIIIIKFKIYIEVRYAIFNEEVIGIVSVIGRWFRCVSNEKQLPPPPMIVGSMASVDSVSSLPGFRMNMAWLWSIVVSERKAVSCKYPVICAS